MNRVFGLVFLVLVLIKNVQNCGVYGGGCGYVPAVVAPCAYAGAYPYLGGYGGGYGCGYGYGRGRGRGCGGRCRR